VSRSNLAKANERRNYRIFEEFAYHLIDEARRVTAIKDFNLNIKSNIRLKDRILKAPGLIPKSWK
jgi:hypothetical protein